MVRKHKQKPSRSPLLEDIVTHAIVGIFKSDYSFEILICIMVGIAILGGFSS